MSRRLHKLEPKTVGFSGYLMIEVPTHAERIEMLKEIGFKLTADGQIENVEMSLDVLSIMLKKSIAVVKEVNLVFEGVPLTSADDLEIYEECVPVIMEISDMLKSGLRLGKK